MRPRWNRQSHRILGVLLQWRALLDKFTKILCNIIVLIGDLILNREILRTCGEIGIRDRFG